MQMRSRTGLLALILLAIILFLASRLYAFIQLFFEHAGVALSQRDVALAHSTPFLDARPQHIPKIIHQVYHDWRNRSMPLDWDEVRQTCISVNPGWEYKLWTRETSREFISNYYPWFLATYDGYTYPVQRVDTIRYFVLLHYGGIYLDLDNGCLEDLTPLLYYPAWTTDGGRGALSNNILGAVPNHPFWQLLTSSLISYNYDYFFPYITISYASGQWFETAIWQKYHYAHPEDRLHRIMMDDRPGTEPWVFFTQTRGGTWRNWDNCLFLWIGDHLVLIALGAVGAIGMVCWRMLRCFGSRPRAMGWKKVDEEYTSDQYP